MQLNVSIDIADAIQAALNAAGINACARPLPYDMADHLPITLVEPLSGGTRYAVVLDRFPVRLSTWAATEADAVEQSARAMAHLVACEGGEMGGVPVYRVAPTNTPYEVEDPAHPDIPRVIHTAHLWVRTRTIESS